MAKTAATRRTPTNLDESLIAELAGRSAKFLPPVLPKDVLLRRRLMVQVERAFMLPLTVVRAAGGFGKTTLLANWAKTARCDVAWLSLTEAEDDLLSLAINIAAAIERVAPGNLASVVPLLRAAEPSAHILGQAFASALGNLPKHLVLILDDAQMISSPQARALIGAMVEFPSPRFHVILSGRAVPEIPGIDHLVAEGLVAEITEKDLRFTEGEGQKFLGGSWERRSREPGRARQALAQAEGWPAGLRLFRMDHSAEEEFGPANAHAIVASLLDREPPQVRQLLLETSMFELVSPGLAQAVMADQAHPDAEESAIAEVLDGLVRREMFVMRVEGSADWHRVHQLLREELLEELRAEEGLSGINRRYLAASGWYEGRGDVERAVHYALLADDSERAAELVERHALAHVDFAPWEEIALLLRRIPKALIERRPGLLALKANVLAEEGRLIAAEATLDRLESVLISRGADASGQLRAEIDGCRAYDRHALYGAVEALPFAEAVLANSEAHAHARGNAVGAMILGMQALGREKEVTRFLETVPSLNTRNIGIGAAIPHVGVLFYHLVGGRYGEMAKVARMFAERAETGSHYLREVGLSRLGTYTYYQGNPKDAEEMLRNIANSASFIYARFDANVGLALALRAVGRCSEAQQIANHLIETLSVSGDNVFEGHARAFAARLALIDGDLPVAEHWLAANQSTTFPPLSSMMEQPRLTRAQIRLARRFRADHELALEEAEAVRNWAVSHHDVSVANQAGVVIAMALAELDRRDEALMVLGQIMDSEFGEQVGVLWDFGPAFHSLLAELAPRSDLPGSAQARRVLETPLPKRSALARARHRTPKKRTSRHGMPLSPREEEVLGYLVERWSNEDIAAELGIAVETVKQHNSAIFEKFGVRGRKQAAEVARRRAAHGAT